MGRATLDRVVAHVASLPDQPICGDVDVDDLCRAMREPVPETGADLRDAARPPLRGVDSPLLHRERARLHGLHPRRRALPGRARRPDRGHVEPLHRHLARRAGAGPARGQRPGVVPRLDAVPGHRGRAPDPGRLDGDLQRRPLRARAAPGAGPPLRARPTSRARCTTASSRRRGLRASCPTASGASPSTTDFRMRVDALREAIAARPGGRAAAVPGRRLGGHDQHRRRRSRSTRSRTSPRASASGSTSTAPTAPFFHACPELRPLLAGLPRADSLALDPHKGLFLPYGTGALLVRDGSRAARRARHRRQLPPACPRATTSTTRPATARTSRAASPACGSGCASSSTAPRACAPPSPRSGSSPSTPPAAWPRSPACACWRRRPCRSSPSTCACRGPRRPTRATPHGPLIDRVRARGKVMITGCEVGGRFVARVCVLSFRTRQAQVDTLVDHVAKEAAAMRGARLA